jgi:8-oxo-dGTP pyrophosphatase MutT (NUDIX family)
MALLKKLFVCGFLTYGALRPDSFVALIRKVRPSWQAGLLNGVGGHIESGETPHDAMVREFEEEAGVHVPRWLHIRTEKYDHPDHPCRMADVYFFHARATHAQWNGLRSMTDEEIVCVPVTQVTKPEHRKEFMFNLPYLIPMGIVLSQKEPCFIPKP